VDGGAGGGDLAAGLARTCTGSLGVHVTNSCDEPVTVVISGTGGKDQTGHGCNYEFDLPVR
jgi:hypothetical protein